MGDKRLDFNAPLLSVRRFHSSISSSATAAAAEAKAREKSSTSSSTATARSATETIANSSSSSNGTAGEKPPQQPPTTDGLPRRSPLPFYKSDLKTGPVRNPGVVPFTWEQSPGRPKDGSGLADPPDTASEPTPSVAPKLPPGRITKRHDADDFNGSDAGNGKPSSKSGSSGGGRGTGSTKPIAPSSSPPEATKSMQTSNGDKAIAAVEVKKPAEQPKPKGRLAEKPLDSAGHVRGGGDDDEDDDAFSDALDTLSRADSCFMNCSVSGMTGVGDAVPSGPSASCFSRDPQLRDFMMGRFLPAAQAMATGSSSPHAASRRPTQTPLALEPLRPAENGEQPRRRVPLPYQHRSRFVPPNPPPLQQQLVDDESDDDEDDDNDGDYVDTRRFGLKGCGLLPKFCLMNPVPGLRVKGRIPSRTVRKRIPAIKPSPNYGSVGEAENESWEAIYKYKLGHGQQVQLDERSKLTSESYQLTCWSDSLSPDGSSPCRRSTGGGVSPYRNDAPLSPFHEGKGFLGFPKRDGNSGKSSSSNSLEFRPHHISKSGSGSGSPAVEKTLYVDSDVPAKSMLGVSENRELLELSDRYSAIAAGNGRKEGNAALESHEWKELHSSSDVNADPPYSADGLNLKRNVDGPKELNCHAEIAGSAHANFEDQGKNDINTMPHLLPPPLPKSPSESWLWRTLPSVSSKTLTSQSFLGIQLHSKTKGNQTSPTDPKWETIVKTSNVHNSQMRFAEVSHLPST